MSTATKKDPRPVLALVLDSIFFFLTYLCPALYSIAWISFGYADYLADLEKQRYGENFYGQTKAFLFVFFILYLAVPVVVYILKSFIYWITRLRTSVLGSLRADLARLFLVLPGLRKLVRATPLREYNPQLYQRLIGWAEAHGNKITDILVLHVMHYTRETNAFFFGVGKFTRVILLDTLFDRYTHPEIEAIIAHEFGHQHDILSNLSIIVTQLFGAVLLVSWGFWYMTTLGSVAFIPSLTLLLVAYLFATKILDNSISKYKEILADTYAALHIVHCSDFKSVLLKLAEESFDILDPPKIVEFLVFSHPATAKRLANIQAVDDARNKGQDS